MGQCAAIWDDRKSRWIVFLFTRIKVVDKHSFDAFKSSLRELHKVILKHPDIQVLNAPRLCGGQGSIPFKRVYRELDTILDRMQQTNLQPGLSMNRQVLLNIWYP